jgi:hypothetical protein
VVALTCKWPTCDGLARPWFCLLHLLDNAADSANRPNVGAPASHLSHLPRMRPSLGGLGPQGARLLFNLQQAKRQDRFKVHFFLGRQGAEPLVERFPTRSDLEGFPSADGVAEFFFRLATASASRAALRVFE